MPTTGSATPSTWIVRPDHAGIGAVAAAPEPVAQHDDVWPVRRLLRVEEVPAVLRA